MKRVLFVLTSHDQLGATGQSTGAYLPEVAHPYHRFHAAGIDVDFASPKGGQPPLYGADRKDARVAEFLDNRENMHKMNNSIPLDEIDPSTYNAVFFAGGHGTMWDFADNPSVQHVAAEIYGSGGIVSAVCHGPAALVNIRLQDGSYLVNGKTVATFTNAEEEAAGLTDVVPFLVETALENRGAKIEKAPNWAAKIVVSDRLVTGQNPASAEGVAEAVIALL